MMLLSRIHRLAVIGIAVPIMAMCWNLSAARAQLGATKDLLALDGRFSSTDLQEFSDALQMEAKHFKCKSNGLEYYLGFRDGKAVCVQIPYLGHQGLYFSRLKSYLSAVKCLDNNQLPTDLEWQLEPGLLSLFPPLGDVQNQMVEVYSSTGIKTRDVTVNALTGRIVGASSWRDIKEGTGIFEFEQTVKSYYRMCLKSTDGRAVALISVEGFQIRGSGAATDRQTIQCIAFMTPEVFWDYTLRSITEDKGINGDGYESFLNSYVPAKSRDRVRLNRTALAIIRCAEFSQLPMDRIVKMYGDQVKAQPAVEAAMAGLLLRSNFQKLAASSQARHYQLLAEIGSVEIISQVVKTMSSDSARKAAAAAALTRLAERHQLGAPPEAKAGVTAFRTWATQVMKNP